MVTAGTLTTGSLVVGIGDLVEYSGAAWIKIVTNSGGFVPDGTRAILSTQTTLMFPFLNGTDDGKIVEFDGTINVPTVTDEANNGFATIITGSGSIFEDRSYYFKGDVSDEELATIMQFSLKGPRRIKSLFSDVIWLYIVFRPGIS